MKLNCDILSENLLLSAQEVLQTYLMALRLCVLPCGGKRINRISVQTVQTTPDRSRETKKLNYRRWTVDALCQLKSCQVLYNCTKIRILKDLR